MLNLTYACGKAVNWVVQGGRLKLELQHPSIECVPLFLFRTELSAQYFVHFNYPKSAVPGIAKEEIMLRFLRQVIHFLLHTT